MGGKKAELRRDIILLKAAWNNWRPYMREYTQTEAALQAYRLYWDMLQAMAAKYNCSIKQMADCMGVKIE